MGDKNTYGEGRKRMADKRMFAKTIVDSDNFLEMPMSARLLYYDLGMRADDDGFVNSPKKIMRIIGASTDDMNILIARKFIIPFDSGIVVIRHWRINNYLRKDRYTETQYVDEKATLAMDDSKKYLSEDEAERLGIPLGIPSVNAEENSKEEKRKEKINKHKYGEYNHVLLSDDEYNRLIRDYGEKAVKDGIKNVDEYCQQYGKSYKDYNLTLRKWGIKSPKLEQLPKTANTPKEEELTEEERIKQLEAEGVKWIT